MTYEDAVRLREENARLREALENIVRYAADCCPNRGSELTRIAWHAMGALRGTEERG